MPITSVCIPDGYPQSTDYSQWAQFVLDFAFLKYTNVSEILNEEDLIVLEVVLFCLFQTWAYITWQDEYYSDFDETWGYLSQHSYLENRGMPLLCGSEYWRMCEYKGEKSLA